MISFSLTFFIIGIIMILIQMLLTHEKTKCSEKTKIIINEKQMSKEDELFYNRPLFNTEITL